MKLKKLLVCGLASVMLMSMSLTAFAAELTTEEKSIITALEAAGVPASQVTKAQNYLATETVTADQATQIISKIDAAKATANGVTTFSALTADQKSAIIADAVDAGNVAGVKITVDAATGSFTTDAGTSESNVIKNTGVNMNTTFAIVAVLAMSLAACGVVVSKKRFAGENA